MTLYLVKDGDRELWVAYQDDQARMWAYDGHTGKFHRSRPLYLDFFWDKENQYTAIDDAQAREAIARGVGKYDKRKLGWLYERHSSETSPERVRPPQEVLTEVEVMPSKEQAAKAKADALINARPGAWITWKTYAKDKRSSADVMASDLRHGKVKAIDRLGMNVFVRVRPSDDALVVEISKQQETVAREPTSPPTAVAAKRAPHKAAAKKPAKKAAKKLVPPPKKAAKKMPSKIAAKAVKRAPVSRSGSASGARAVR